jgi:superfamily II DNA or RNA helicase
MKLRDYQLYAFNKLIKHDNSFIFWPRQIGKSFLLSAYIEYFVNYNNDQDIVFICDIGKYIDNSKSKLVNDLPYLIEKIRKNDIEFINSNYVSFFSFQSDFIQQLYSLKPSLIIYDEFFISKNMKEANNFTELFNYMNNSRCKSLFTSTRIDMRIIKALDNFFFNCRK